jgi:hypothetical protein
LQKGILYFLRTWKREFFSPEVGLSPVDEGRAGSGSRKNEEWQHLFKTFQQGVGYK